MWLAGDNSNKNGVAVLFNNNFEYKLHNVIRDLNGYFLILDIEILNKGLTLANQWWI